MNAQLRATFIGSISIFLWGTLALLTALTEGRIPALQLMAMTFAIAFALMCLRWWRQGHSGIRHLRQPPLAWLIGVASLCAVAILVHGRLNEQDLDAELALQASVVYGLAWIDEAGDFHDEALRREPDLLDGPHDLWLMTETKVHLSPEAPIFLEKSVPPHHRTAPGELR